MAKALITGASSGIGREMARILAHMGYELVITARRGDRLEELKNELSVPCKTVTADLSDREAPARLFEDNRDAEILINNAGFGVFGAFDTTALSREEQMLDVNINKVSIDVIIFLYFFMFSSSNKIVDNCSFCEYS